MDDGHGDPNRLPIVQVGSVFKRPLDPSDVLLIYKTEVIVGERRFLVYGYVWDEFERNLAISAIKPSTIWRGEVVVFCLGTRVPILSRPHLKKEILDAAVAL